MRVKWRLGTKYYSETPKQTNCLQITTTVLVNSDRNRGEIILRKTDGVDIKRNVSLTNFVKKYQENGTSESESVAPLQPIASPISVQQTVNPSSPML